MGARKSVVFRLTETDGTDEEYPVVLESSYDGEPFGIVNRFRGRNFDADRIRGLALRQAVSARYDYGIPSVLLILQGTAITDNFMDTIMIKI